MGQFSGIGAAIANVADKLRKERETGAETGQKVNLLGYAASLEGWKPKTQEEALVFEKAKQRPTGGIKEEILRKMATGEPITVEEQKIYDEIIAKEKEFKITGTDIKAQEPVGLGEKISTLFGGGAAPRIRALQKQQFKQITGNKDPLGLR